MYRGSAWAVRSSDLFSQGGTFFLLTPCTWFSASCDLNRTVCAVTYCDRSYHVWRHMVDAKKLKSNSLVVVFFTDTHGSVCHAWLPGRKRLLANCKTQLSSGNVMLSGSGQAPSLANGARLRHRTNIQEASLLSVRKRGSFDKPSDLESHGWASPDSSRHKWLPMTTTPWKA